MDRRKELVRFDWAIKRILRDKANFDVLEGFLSVVLKDDVKIVEILESESNKQSDDDKFNRVDIKARNSKGEIIIVEVQNTREADEFSEEAREKLRLISMSKEEQNAYEKYLHDEASFLYTQKVEKEYAHAEGRAEGLAEGRAEGLAEGRAEGLAEGHAKGITEGAQNEKKIIAANMKHMGISTEVISQSTGLSADEINSL